MTKRIVELLTRPMTAGFIAAITTALILPPTVVHNESVVERVLIRDPVTPQVTHEVVYRTQRVCDGESVIRALNEALGSLAKTGKAGVDNVADASARARAKGDAAASVAQSGVATSGDAVAGVVIDIINLCGNVEVVAHNQVSDVTLTTGDALVINEAEVEAYAGSRIPSPTPTLSPTPSPSPSPAPSPDASALPVSEDGAKCTPPECDEQEVPGK